MPDVFRQRRLLEQIDQEIALHQAFPDEMRRRLDDCKELSLSSEDRAVLDEVIKQQCEENIAQLRAMRQEIEQS